MDNITLYQILCFFIIYSFVGWCTEVAYQAVNKGQIINRGFLNGPICPIYGFGVISVIILIRTIGEGHPETMNAAGIFVIGVVIATAIELFGGWILDVIFHARWWDYRDRKFNLNGYICPQFSIAWGMGILIIVRIIHPFIRDAVMLPDESRWTWSILAVLYAVLIADVSVSVFIMLGLNKRLAELDEIQRKMRVVSDRLSTRIGEDTLEKIEKAEQLKEESARVREGLREGMEELSEDRQLRMAEAREELQARLSDMEQKYANRRKELIRRTSHRLHGAGRMLFDNPTFEMRDYISFIQDIKQEHRRR